jgi:branched-chain amino acid transport system substrate-binding protein
MGRRTILTAVLLSGALAVAACGDDTGSAQGPTTSVAGSGAGRTVSIGVLSPIDGGLVDFGRGIRNSVELAVREANAANAVPGWTIAVRAVDDSSDPKKGETGAATLVADRDVVAVVGTYNSGVALAALPTLAKADLALVSPGNTLSALTVGDNPLTPKRPYANYFRLVGSDKRQGEFLAERALALNYRTVAIVSETKAVSKGLADVFATAYQAAGGTIIVREVVPDGATAFGGFAKMSAGADLIFFGGEYPVAARLRTQANPAVPIMGGDGIKDDAFVTAAGAAAAGTLASSVGVPLAELTSATAYLAAYRAAGFTEPPSDFGPYAYDAANAIIRTLRTALANVTSPADARAAVVTALGSVAFDGATGKVAFDAFGDTTAPRFTLYKVAGTAWVAQK